MTPRPDTPLISVIVPVFNTEAEYLKDCVASVERQTYSNWELLLIDDGSTNGIGRICDSLSENDSRISVVHRENGGLSTARNTGIDYAKGAYIFFLDSDDMMMDYALEVLAESVLSCRPDMAIGRFVESENPVYTPDKRADRQCLPPERVLENSLYQQGILHSACGKLFRREIFDKERFSDGLYYEDLDFFYRACFCCKSIAVLNSCVYFYRQHGGSFIHTWSDHRLDVLTVTDRIEKYIGENIPELLPAARDRKFSANFNIFILAVLNRQDEAARRCWSVIRKYRWRALTDPKVRFKNKAGALLSCGGFGFCRLIARWLGK